MAGTIVVLHLRYIPQDDGAIGDGFRLRLDEPLGSLLIVVIAAGAEGHQIRSALVRDCLV
jgi:hypothetical protein